MTALDPPAVGCVGVEAVEVAAQELYERLCKGDDPVLGFAFTRKIYLRAAEAALAAALPHLEARFLAEVDAALRAKADEIEAEGDPDFSWLSAGYVDAADYLRDTLAPDAEEAT